MTDTPAAAFHDSRQLAIVIERRPLASAWTSEAWQPVAVLDEAGEPGVRCLRDDGRVAQFIVSPVELALHRSDASSYRYNLAGERPSLFVALRRDETAAPVPWQVLLVTAAPDEAQKLMDSGEDVVEAIAMPPGVAQWVAAFVETCPPEEPFEKRRRKNWRDEAAR